MMRAIGKYIEVWHYPDGLKELRLNDVIGSRKSLSEQRSSHSYPFRMCFRHRADAGYFLQPIRIVEAQC
ncbi:hypothetical protein E3A64_21320 [Salmonella enterica]|nr:hypothetical protein [Salmonella enterica]EAT7575945.1 hypothetical protein [Salmonella enterica]